MKRGVNDAQEEVERVEVQRASGGRSRITTHDGRDERLPYSVDRWRVDGGGGSTVLSEGGEPELDGGGRSARSSGGWFSSDDAVVGDVTAVLKVEY